MTVNEVKPAFVALPAPRKLRVLALWAHNITIYARAAYPGQVDERLVARKLCAFNELEHTMTGQLMHMIAGNGDRYPDDVFIDVLAEKAQQGGCEKDLIEAFEWSCSAS